MLGVIRLHRESLSRNLLLIKTFGGPVQEIRLKEGFTFAGEMFLTEINRAQRNP